MKEACFSIINWNAWAPGLESAACWQEWSNGNKSISDDYSLSPVLNNIPVMQTRRLSNLTKMSLKVALESGNGYEQLESVFASRYGEWEQTVKLLRSISSKEETSPAGFSMSVHNTAGGIYSILSKNTAAYTALASCSATFDSALVEALGRLQTQDYVLMVIAEEAMPAIYEGIFPKPIEPYAIAFLLGKKDNKKAIGKFSLTQTKKRSEHIEALDFLKWFIGKKQPAKINSSFFEIKHV